jgi:hypothetical protein
MKTVLYSVKQLLLTHGPKGAVHSALLEKQKTRKYKYLRTSNSYQLKISLLVVCPLELIFNASFSQEIKKKFSGP